MTLAPRAVLVGAALVSLVVLGSAGLATYGDPGRRWVRLVGPADPGALPAWWSTVLYALVTLACLLRAAEEAAGRHDGGGGGRAGPLGAVLGPAAWLLLGGLLTVLSVDAVLGLQQLVAGDRRLTALPALVAAQPVKVVLVAAALPVVAVLGAVVGRRQRLLLVAAGCLYLVSEVLLDQRLLQPSWSFARVETLELAFEWSGALVLALTAVSGPAGTGATTAAVREGATRYGDQRAEAPQEPFSNPLPEVRRGQHRGRRST